MDGIRQFWRLKLIWSTNRRIFRFRLGHCSKVYVWKVEVSTALLVCAFFAQLRSSIDAQGRWILKLHARCIHISEMNACVLNCWNFTRIFQLRPFRKFTANCSRFCVQKHWNILVSLHRKYIHAFACITQEMCERKDGNRTDITKLFVSWIFWFRANKHSCKKTKLFGVQKFMPETAKLLPMSKKTRVFNVFQYDDGLRIKPLGNTLSCIIFLRVYRRSGWTFVQSPTAKLALYNHCCKTTSKFFQKSGKYVNLPDLYENFMSSSKTFSLFCKRVRCDCCFMCSSIAALLKIYAQKSWPPRLENVEKESGLHF